MTLFCFLLNLSLRESRDAMANVLDCESVANEFEFQSCFYIHFRINTLGKGMNSPILPSYMLNSGTHIILRECFGDK